MSNTEKTPETENANTDAAGESVWETTKEQNLLRNKTSGRYYGRWSIIVNGKSKQKWVSLKTDKWSVALLRIAEKRGAILGQRAARKQVTAGVANMGQLADIYNADALNDTSIAPISRLRKLEYSKYLRRTWPGFDKLMPERITKDQVVAWRDRVRKQGGGYKNLGAKSTHVYGNSSSTINKVIDALRAMLNIAFDRGQITRNPLVFAKGQKGVKLPAIYKKPKLPTPAQLEGIFQYLDESSSRGGRLEAGDFARFLSFTGTRLEEARGVHWKHIDFTEGSMIVNGTKTPASRRTIFIIPAALELLEKIRARRLDEAEALTGKRTLNMDEPVLGVRQIMVGLTNACKKVGCERLTHHDLRDMFTTICIEADVPIPTLAAWLGHKDGGALLLKTYAHVRDHHSKLQAARVQFGLKNPAAPTPPTPDLTKIREALALPASATLETIIAIMAAKLIPAGPAAGSVPTT